MADNLPADPIQYEDVYAEVPQWPKVVGIISLVWAGLGLCCTGYGIFNMIRGVPSGNGPGQMPDDLAKAMEAQQHSPLSLVGFAMGGLGVFLLLSAGILTITRRPAGRYLHLAYALLSLVNFGLMVFGMSQTLHIMQDWAAQNPTHEFAKAMGVISTVMKITMVFAGVLSAGYPLFLLVWFGLVKRTPESMTGIPDGVGAPPAA